MARKSKIRNLLRIIWEYLVTTFKLLWIAFIVYMLFRMIYHFGIGDQEKALLNAIGAFSGMTLLLELHHD